MDTLVLYHGDCPDGFTSAWAAYKKFGDRADYKSVNYSDLEIPDVTDKDVYILDFSYKRDDLMLLSDMARSLTVLDHHLTAKDDLEGMPGCFFDMDRSGAGMSWDFFHPNTKRPLLVDCVEDRDLWRFSVPKSVEINAVVTSYTFSFDNWNLLDHRLSTNPGVVCSEGEAILRAKGSYVEQMKLQAINSTFKGYSDIPVVNAPFYAVSELLNSLAKDSLFSVGWRQINNGLFVYSLRSDEEGSNFDVSSLARSLGGGGHWNSAGFTSEEGPWAL
tara:strand:- start:2248 stop:3069 length:822 start_codon:yes stop_codon:yes gene_type:complete